MPKTIDPKALRDEYNKARGVHASDYDFSRYTQVRALLNIDPSLGYAESFPAIDGAAARYTGGRIKSLSTYGNLTKEVAN